MNRLAFVFPLVTVFVLSACSGDDDDDYNRGSVDRHVQLMLQANADMADRFCDCHAEYIDLSSAECRTSMVGDVSPCAMTVMRQDAEASADVLSCVAAAYIEAEACFVSCDVNLAIDCLDRHSAQVDQCLSLYTNAQFAALQQCNGTGSSPEENRFDLAVDTYDDAVAQQLDVACTCSYSSPSDRDTCFAANYVSVTEDACFMNTIRLDPAGSAAFLSCAADAVDWSAGCLATCPSDMDPCAADLSVCVELLSPTVLAELQGC